MNCYLALCYFEQYHPLLLLVKADNESDVHMHAREFCRDKVFSLHEEPRQIRVIDINRGIDQLLQSQEQALHIWGITPPMWYA